MRLCRDNAVLVVRIVVSLSRSIKRERREDRCQKKLSQCRARRWQLQGSQMVVLAVSLGRWCSGLLVLVVLARFVALASVLWISFLSFDVKVTRGISTDVRTVDVQNLILNHEIERIPFSSIDHHTILGRRPLDNEHRRTTSTTPFPTLWKDEPLYLSNEEDYDKT